MLRSVIFILLISIGVNNSGNAQLVNGNFENWTNGFPNGWYVEGDMSQTTRSQDEEFAITGQTIEQEVDGRVFIVGPRLAATDFNSDAGFPIDYRPNALTGYYIFEPQEGDRSSLMISIQLTYWTPEGRRAVGIASKTIPYTANLDTVYTYFKLPVFYVNNMMPDTVSVQASIDGSEIPGSRFYLDNLSLRSMEMTSPEEGDLVVAGHTDTLRWTSATEFLNILYSEDEGETFTTVENSYPADSLEYAWEVPEELLTTKGIIRLENPDDSDDYFDQPVRIKPLIITRLDENGDYIDYDINADRWGFANTPAGVWPQSWWSQFDYTGDGIDPFTTGPYNIQFSLFPDSAASTHVDWVSFVNTFGVDASYINSDKGIYSPSAISYWQSISGPWGGSCFGIAISNAMVFQDKSRFLSYYSDFPSFSTPSSVTGNNQTYPVINELFTHQFGDPHNSAWNVNRQKTPSQTVAEMIAMFEVDEVRIKTLSFLSNSQKDDEQGGHAVLAYKIRQDMEQKNLYYVYVYDNSYSNLTNAQILVDVNANGGTGSWTPLYGWANWGGSRWFALEDPADQYYDMDTRPKSQSRSPFIPKTGETNLYQSNAASLIIKDRNGNAFGFSADSSVSALPGIKPIFLKNGAEGPPIGYKIPTDEYSIEAVSTDSLMSLSVFSENRSYLINRKGASESQTDQIFLNNGISIMNSDQQVKSFSVTETINEGIQEKYFSVRDLMMAAGDSVSLSNTDDKTLTLSNYGSAKTYALEAGLYTSERISPFSNTRVSLSANTTHILSPAWADTTALPLKIYIDEGNDGIINDSLDVTNLLVSNENESNQAIPTTFQLAQNYPNPFNPTTSINYQLPAQQRVQLKVYNLLGQEVAILVNEVQTAGNYNVTFDASGLSSGVYLLVMQAGGYTETRKMTLIK